MFVVWVVFGGSSCRGIVAFFICSDWFSLAWENWIEELPQLGSAFVILIPIRFGVWCLVFWVEYVEME